MGRVIATKENSEFSSDAKLCKNCKFFRGLSNGPYFCHRPIKVETSLVTGAVEFRPKCSTCELEREDSNYVDRCGKEGKYWVKCESAAYKISNFFKNFLKND